MRLRTVCTAAADAVSGLPALNRGASSAISVSAKSIPAVTLDPAVHYAPVLASRQIGLVGTRLGKTKGPRSVGRAFNQSFKLLLGHTKVESTVRYLGIEVDDALSLSEQVEL
jgi:hypothetical protein